MKPLIRVASLAVLAGVLITPWLGVSRPAAVVPFRGPTTLEDLRARGVIRLAVEKGTLTYFVHHGVARGFEYDLLGRFASERGLRVSPRFVTSPRDAAARLRAGLVDVAVLPWVRNQRIDGAVRVGPYVRDGAEPAFPETGALFVRDDAPEVRREIEAFLARVSRDGSGTELLTRYFSKDRTFAATRQGDRLVFGNARISTYDSLIAKHAGRAGFDWRLVAAVIFRESRFDSRAVSPKGARGLMQLMPSVAGEQGVRNMHEPENNIRGGVEYLQRLSRTFSESVGDDHLAIVLAAYLMGPGHVIDAQEIARTLGLHTNLWWGGLKQVLPLLEDPTFHVHTRSGFARGRHAVDYVEQIFQRYELYRANAENVPVESARTTHSDRAA